MNRMVYPLSAGLWRQSGGCTAAAILVFSVCVFPFRVPAVELFPVGSEVTGHLDTTISTGVAVRTRGRASDLVGVSNGGTAHSINEDDGNLNYDKGDVVSANVKITHELDVSRDNLGLFLRAYYFHDQAVADNDPARTSLSGKAKRYAGSDIKLLDAYVSGHFDPGGTPVSIRAGNQVISWGESVFLRNGLNSINPVDVSKLRVAGAELRDVLEPVPALNLSAGLTGNLSVETFYQFRSVHTEIEPAGTFFSTNDYASPGGRIAHTGFGQVHYADDNDGTPDPGCNPLPAGGLCSRVPRAGDRDAGDDGQFGLVLRYFAPGLNNIELGFYFARIHSRLPVVSLRAGSLSELTMPGGFMGSARYFREFPEDIDLMGLSFNTELGTTGFAIQGELSYRRDQPLQIDGAELFFSALSPLRNVPGPFAGLGRLLAANSQTGPLDSGQELSGYRRKDVLQGSLALTRVLGPMFGADQTVFLVETGFTRVRDMEKKSELRYEGPGTWTSANPVFTVNGLQPATQAGGFADPFSWGYRLLMRTTYSNAVGPVTLSPEVAFAHDVNGTAPSPIGNFVEDRKTITLALNASYLHSWQARLSYTNSFDGGPHNLLRDRDFLSFTLNYSF
ncbi:MAG: DUF1302 domain-containing protein [Gammaproteobacteria bacterium]|nr:DUF1302 domain-containing protein [Gammaproteobacteria bacterium]